MKTLHESYWKKFTKKDLHGNTIGDGEKFEDLVGNLLCIMFGKEWKRTQVTHDNNRDFWTKIENDIYWAECKNYNDSISMKILAPTMIMAQVLDATTILFFSRSDINKKAKQKILLYGNKSKRHIIFYDGERLSALIIKYANDLPSKYRPIIANSINNIPASPKVSLSFLSLAQNKINADEIDFIEYTKLKEVSLYKIYTLIFTIDNPDLSKKNSFRICFDENENNSDRYLFEYLNIDIQSDNTLIYSGSILPGELTTFSIMFRPVKFKKTLFLPRFSVIFENTDYIWISKPINIKCFWTGDSGFIGNSHINIKENITKTTIDKKEFSLAILTGRSGVGKTRTVKECITEFYKHGYKLTSLIASSSISDIKLIEEIICSIFDIPKAIVYEALDQLLDGTDEDISGFPSENNDVYKLVRFLIIMRYAGKNKKIYQFIDQYGDIIFSMLEREKRIIFIDDAHTLHDEARYFIKKWIAYSVNSVYSNHAVAMLVYTSDIMTDKDRVFIDELSHMGIQNFYFSELQGFEDVKQSIVYIQHLLRLDASYDTDIFEIMAEKNDNNPYYIYQTVRLWEEQNLIVRNQDDYGYLIIDEKTLEIAISNMAKEEALKTIFKTILKTYTSQVNDFFRLLSLIFLVEKVSQRKMDQFDISLDLINIVEHTGLIKSYRNDYEFDHDAVRVFFSKHYKNHLLDALLYSNLKKTSNKVLSPTLKLIDKIYIEKDLNIIVKNALDSGNIIVPSHIEQLFYELLLEASINIPNSFNNIGDWLRSINVICSKIRSIAGSTLAKEYYLESYNVLTERYNDFSGIYSLYLRNFLHSFCDILLQTHDTETISTIKDILNRTLTISSCNAEEDERIVIQSIMYNRWYNVYNNEKPTESIISERKHLLKLSREGILKINDVRKRGLIEYLNWSDEGYNYYGYEKDRNKLYMIWSACLKNIPETVPEKTLNYYRKCIQFDLIEKNVEKAVIHIETGRRYLKEGEYRHEPLIFNAFFDTAEIMAKLQSKECDYKSYNKMVSNIILIHRALNSTKVPDLLWIRGILAFYMSDYLGAKQYFEEAHRHYDETKLTRNYWIKMYLLEENIHNLTVDSKSQETVSGIIRTFDDRFNLPLIS